MASQAGDAKLAVVSLDSEADTPSPAASVTSSARPAILRSAPSHRASASPTPSAAVANAIKVLGAAPPAASSSSKLIPIQIIPSAAISSSLPRIISNGTKAIATSGSKALIVANLHGTSPATAGAILQTAAASPRGPALAVVRKLVAISPRSPTTAAMAKPSHASASLPNILRATSTAFSASPKSSATLSGSAPKPSEWKPPAVNGKEERLETDLAEAECAAVPHEVKDEIEGTADVHDVTEPELPQAELLGPGVDVNALLLPLEDGDAFSEDAKDSMDKLKCRLNDLGAIELEEDLTANESMADDDEDIDLTCKEETPLSPKLKEGSPPSAAAAPKPRDTDIVSCKGCGCYGMAGEFHDSESCSAECKRRIKEKIREREKKERELLVQKARREAKKKEKQMEKEAAAVSFVKQRPSIKCEEEVVPAAGDDGSPEMSAEKAENNGLDPESRSALLEGSGLQRGNRKRKRPKFFDEEASSTRSASPPAPPSAAAGAKCADRPWQLSKEAEIRLSVFRPPDAVSGAEAVDPRPIGWRRNAAFLQPLVKGLTTGAVRRWTAEDVAALVTSLPCLDPGVAKKLVEQEVDGESFLLLTQGDLMNGLGVKLGQALKVINAIHLIKSNA